MWRITSFGLLIVMLLSACSSAPKYLLLEHPLVDKIWDVKRQAFIDKPSLMTRAIENEFLLLGERHDNRVHHQHHAWVIQQLAKSSIEASVAFEMIDNDKAEILARQPITSVDQFVAVLDQTDTGWDYEQQYKPLFAEVLAAGYKIDGANLQTGQLMQLVEKGEDNLPAAYTTILNKTPFSTHQFKALQQEINDSHCNYLDDATSNNLVLAQRVRDTVMAESLLKSRASLKVLIAGNGHVRNDRAVPLYLRSSLDKPAEKARIYSIGLVEVEANETEPGAYARQWDDSDIPFDVVWFTPKVKRNDPCEALKKHFKKDQA